MNNLDARCYNYHNRAPQTPGAPEGEAEFKPYELIEPIEALGAFSYNPLEDEISKTKIKYQRIEGQIKRILAQFEEVNKTGEYTMWDEYRDAKTYLEGRLRAVEHVLDQLKH